MSSDKTDQFFRDGLEGHKASPDDALWGKIDAQLGAPAQVAWYAGSKLWLIAGVVSVLGVAGFLGYRNMQLQEKVEKIEASLVADQQELEEKNDAVNFQKNDTQEIDHALQPANETQEKEQPNNRRIGELKNGTKANAAKAEFAQPSSGESLDRETLKLATESNEREGSMPNIQEVQDEGTNAGSNKSILELNRIETPSFKSEVEIATSQNIVSVSPRVESFFTTTAQSASVGAFPSQDEVYGIAVVSDSTATFGKEQSAILEMEKRKTETALLPQGQSNGREPTTKWVDVYTKEASGKRDFKTSYPFDRARKHSELKGLFLQNYNPWSKRGTEFELAFLVNQNGALQRSNEIALNSFGENIDLTIEKDRSFGVSGRAILWSLKNRPRFAFGFEFNNWNVTNTQELLFTEDVSAGIGTLGTEGWQENVPLVTLAGEIEGVATSDSYPFSFSESSGTEQFTVNARASQQYQYISFPIDVEMQLGYARTRLAGSLGLSYDAISRRKKSWTTDNDRIAIEPLKTEQIKSAFFSLNGRLGVMHTLTENITLSAHYRYKYALGIIDRNTDYRYSPRVSSLVIGLRFNIDSDYLHKTYVTPTRLYALD